MRASLSLRTLSLTLALCASAGLLPASALAQGAPPQGAQAVAWTTFKGDISRSGSSSAKISLPLALQWRFTSEGPARTYNTSPLIIGGPGRERVVFAVGSEVLAVDINTGQQIWKSPPTLSTDIVTPLTLLSTDEGDFIVGAQSNGRIFALDALRGTVKWSTETRGSMTRTGPLVLETSAGTRIIAALSTGTIVAFDTAGKAIPNWKVALDRFSVNTVGAFAVSPNKSRLFVQTTDQKIACIDAAAGRLMWRASLPGRLNETPVATDNFVITLAGEQIVALRTDNGSIAWRARSNGPVVSSPSLLRANGAETLFVGTRTGNFQAFDARTGDVLWDKKFDANFSGSPLVLPNLIINGTSNGLLLGLDPKSGEQLWTYRLRTDRAITPRTPRLTPTAGGEGGAPGAEAAPATETPAEVVRVFPVSSAPAAINNRVFVLGDNASLYAFSSSAFDADPPRAVAPTLTVPDTAKQLFAMLLDRPTAVPGIGPIYFSVELDDVGSGIDPTSVKFTLDSTEIPANQVDYDLASGVVTITLMDRTTGGTSLSEGLRTIAITGRDYAGNELNFSASFSIDSLAESPPAPVLATPGGGAPEGFGAPMF